jgi:hypothetical protein
MKVYVPGFLNVVAKITLLALLVCMSIPAHTSVLFEDSVQDFQISGPVALSAGQNASVCATNLDDSPVSILIGLLQADMPSLLASKQVTLAPGEGTCLNFSRQVQPNGGLQAGGNVIGVIVPDGHVNSQGVIVQDRRSGGCVTASLQIQFGNAANLPGQTLLFVPMQEHRSAPRRHDRD